MTSSLPARIGLCGLALLFAAALPAACGSARRGEPAAGPMIFGSPKEERGEKVFLRHCNECHPGGEAGVGPALNNKPLPAFLVKGQVRKGVGAMPSFSRDALPDRELDDLAAYIRALRER